MSGDAFKNKPEDFLNKGIRAGTGMLPVVGGPLNEFLELIIGNPAQERRDEFIKGTLERVVNLEAQFANFHEEALRTNEQFQVTFLQSVRLASITASAEKKKLLQNAILNSALIAIDEFVRDTLMRILEEVSPLHVVFLNFFANPRAYPAAVEKAKSTMMGSFSNIIETALPEHTKDKVAYARVLADLVRLGLADVGNVNAMGTGGEGMLNKRETQLGALFLDFIKEPEAIA